MPEEIEDQKTETATTVASEKEPTPEELQAQANDFLSEWFDNGRLGRHKPPPIRDNPDDDRPAAVEEGDNKSDAGKDDQQKTSEKAPEKKDEKEPEKEAAKAPDSEKAKPNLPGLASSTDAVLPEKQDRKTATPIASEEEVLEENPVEERLNRIETQLSKKAEAPALEDPFAGYDAKDRQQLQILQQLEKQPEFKGRNLVQETKDFWKREEAYIDKWVRENPGEKFDVNDSQHAEFYKKWEPVTSEVMEEAMTELRAQRLLDERLPKAVEERMRPIESRLRETEIREARRQATPIIERSANQSVLQLVAEAVPEFKTILEGHKGRLTPEALATMEEVDPVALKAVDREAQALKARVRAMDTMVHLGGMVKIDPNQRIRTDAGDVITPVMDIVEIGLDLEEAIKNGPPEGKVRDGRRFITKAEMQRRLEKANGNEAAIDSILDSFWMIDAEQIKQEMVRRSAARVKEIVTLADERVKHVERKNAKIATSPAPGVSKNGDGMPSKAAEKKAPTTVTSSDNVDTIRKGGASNEENEKVFAARFFH